MSMFSQLRYSAYKMAHKTKPARAYMARRAGQLGRWTGNQLKKGAQATGRYAARQGKAAMDAWHKTELYQVNKPNKPKAPPRDHDTVDGKVTHMTYVMDHGRALGVLPAKWFMRAYARNEQHDALGSTAWNEIKAAVLPMILFTAGVRDDDMEVGKLLVKKEQLKKDPNFTTEKEIAFNANMRKTAANIIAGENRPKQEQVLQRSLRDEQLQREHDFIQKLAAQKEISPNEFAAQLKTLKDMSAESRVRALATLRALSSDDAQKEQAFSNMIMYADVLDEAMGKVTQGFYDGDTVARSLEKGFLDGVINVEELASIPDLPVRFQEMEKARAEATKAKKEAAAAQSTDTILDDHKRFMPPENSAEDSEENAEEEYDDEGIEEDADPSVITMDEFVEHMQNLHAMAMTQGALETYMQDLLAKEEEEMTEDDAPEEQFSYFVERFDVIAAAHKTLLASSVIDEDASPLVLAIQQGYATGSLNWVELAGLAEDELQLRLSQEITNGLAAATVQDNIETPDTASVEPDPQHIELPPARSIGVAVIKPEEIKNPNVVTQKSVQKKILVDMVAEKNRITTLLKKDELDAADFANEVQYIYSIQNDPSLLQAHINQIEELENTQPGIKNKSLSGFVRNFDIINASYESATNNLINKVEFEPNKLTSVMRASIQSRQFNLDEIVRIAEEQKRKLAAQNPLTQGAA